MAEKKCVKCGAHCSGDLCNFLDAKTKEDVKDYLGDYKFGELIYEGPVCYGCYHPTRDDYAWLSGTGRYGQ